MTTGKITKFKPSENEVYDIRDDRFGIKDFGGTLADNYGIIYDGTNQQWNFERIQTEDERFQFFDFEINFSTETVITDVTQTQVSTALAEGKIVFAKVAGTGMEGYVYALVSADGYSFYLIAGESSSTFTNIIVQWGLEWNSSTSSWNFVEYEFPDKAALSVENGYDSLAYGQIYFLDAFMRKGEQGNQQIGGASDVFNELEASIKSNTSNIATNKTNIQKNTTSISNIKDGTSLDSFKDVETALANKQNSSISIEGITATTVETALKEVSDNNATQDQSIALLNNSILSLSEGKVNVSDIVDDLTSEMIADKPLSANQGYVLDQAKQNKTIADAEGYFTTDTVEGALKELAETDDTLQDEIDNLKARGRFLSIWDCTTGKPQTEPSATPYAYTSGDYFIVGVVGTTNYKPSGSSYTGAASTVAETDTVSVEDVYYYDKDNGWLLQKISQKTIAFANIAGDARDNTDLKSEFEAIDTSLATSLANDRILNSGDSTSTEEMKRKMDYTNPTGTGYFSLNRRSSTEIGSYSFVEGYGNQATGNYGSHAEGGNTKATGEWGSHAEGNETVASGTASHAEGYRTEATGYHSHAEGTSTKAQGYYTHAEGYNTLAVAGHAEGIGTQSLASAGAHAEGSHTIAQDTQHAGGSYNIKLKGRPGGTYVSESYEAGEKAYIASTNSWRNNEYYRIVLYGKAETNVYATMPLIETTDFTISEDSKTITLTDEAINKCADWEEILRIQCIINPKAPNGYLRVIGNGMENERSNAFALRADGTGLYAKDVYVNCNDDSTGGTKVKICQTAVVDPVVTDAVSNEFISSITQNENGVIEVQKKKVFQDYVVERGTEIGPTSSEVEVERLVPGEGKYVALGEESEDYEKAILSIYGYYIEAYQIQAANIMGSNFYGNLIGSVSASSSSGDGIYVDGRPVVTENLNLYYVTVPDGEYEYVYKCKVTVVNGQKTYDYSWRPLIEE